MTRDQALILIKNLMSAYPRQDLDRDSIDMYVNNLIDLDFEVAKDVVYKHIRTGKWFPSIAELREASVEKISSLPSVEEAMTVLRDAVRGANYSMLGHNPLLKQAVGTVGWHKIMSSEYPEPLYKQVRDSYERLRAGKMEELTVAVFNSQKALTGGEDNE